MDLVVRGLDIEGVGLVINYFVVCIGDDYVYWVGRMGWVG